MSGSRHLSGSCNCGRYNHVILLPSDSTARRAAQVHFGSGIDDRRSQTSLLSAWLRVPLEWYHSATIAFFDDETHDLIQRTFNPIHESSSQRKFCGYCGTHMSYWTERPESEQDFMHITLGSLRGSDLEALADMDMLPQDLEEEVERSTSSTPAADSAVNNRNTAVATTQAQDGGVVRHSRQGVTGGISWFEDILEGSRLGSHSKRRRGHGTSADGTTSIQWEVSEFVEGMDDDSEVTTTTTRSKRKAGDITGDDVTMQE